MCRQSDAKLSSNLSAFKISLFVASPVPCGLLAFHIKFTLTMAQDLWTLQEKEEESNPAHGPPLQARVVAANRTVLTASATILAHMEMNKWGAKQN